MKVTNCILVCLTLFMFCSCAPNDAQETIPIDGSDIVGNWEGVKDLRFSNDVRIKQSLQLEYSDDGTFWAEISSEAYYVSNGFSIISFRNDGGGKWRIDDGTLISKYSGFGAALFDSNNPDFDQITYTKRILHPLLDNEKRISVVSLSPIAMTLEEPTMDARYELKRVQNHSE